MRHAVKLESFFALYDGKTLKITKHFFIILKN